MTKKTKNAIVVSLTNNLSEIKQLGNSLGYDIVQEFIQNRKNPDVNFFIGSGKLEEIKDYIGSQLEKIDLLIINAELKPSQWFSLEKELHIDVFDRIRLILAIFEERAERKEAKLQVKLAQLQYERPFVRELIHRARAGEHPGLMAGGEYQVDDYYEMIKKQMKKIKQELVKIRRNREIHRQTRHRSGFYLISLAGYTNAGKSSLLNLLSHEKVKVEGRLFSTLSTTTRRIKKDSKSKNIPILLTDTVGFIDNLPTWIIEAFHSTLEEIGVADEVILVVDGGEENKIVEKKLLVSLNELQDLGFTANIIIALNKIDLINKIEIENLFHYLDKKGLINDKTFVPISVKNKSNIGQLIDTIYSSLPNKIQISLKLPINKETQAFVSDLYDKTGILNIYYTDCITITIECNEKIMDKIISKCELLHGTLI